MLKVDMSLVFPRASVGLALYAAVALAGCGQRGPLYLPTEPAAANRATLPQSILPTLPGKVQPAGPESRTPKAPTTPVPKGTP